MIGINVSSPPLTQQGIFQICLFPMQYILTVLNLAACTCLYVCMYVHEHVCALCAYAFQHVLLIRNKTVSPDPTHMYVHTHTHTRLHAYGVSFIHNETTPFSPHPVSPHKSEHICLACAKRLEKHSKI